MGAEAKPSPERIDWELERIEFNFVKELTKDFYLKLLLWHERRKKVALALNIPPTYDHGELKEVLHEIFTLAKSVATNECDERASELIPPGMHHTSEDFAEKLSRLEREAKMLLEWPEEGVVRVKLYFQETSEDEEDETEEADELGDNEANLALAPGPDTHFFYVQDFKGDLTPIFHESTEDGNEGE